MDRRARDLGGVPNLPQYKVAAPAPVDTQHKKLQTLKYVNGYAVPAELAPPVAPEGCSWSIPAAPAAAASASPSAAAAAAAACPAAMPKWVTHDRHVLRYGAYFREDVPDSPVESWRARRVQILFYLSSDELQVDEPREANSGLLQGTLVKRHRAPKEGGGFFGPADFAVGGSIRLYGRELHIIDADAFTRAEHQAAGMPLAPALPLPVNPIDEYKAAKSKPSGLSRADPDSPSKFAEALLGKEAGSKRLQAFLEHSHEVLRFYALWDDRAALYGDRRLFEIHYFVASAEVEVVELLEPNSGREPFTFLKRGPLPRGGHAPVLGARPDPASLVAPTDLRLGSLLNVHGRQMYLFDIDNATRRWYQEHLGASPEELAPIDVSQPAAPLPVPALPPYNGFGSHEDSLQNVKRLIPVQPKKGMYKLMNKDRIVLRFAARMLPAPGARLVDNDADRRFVVSFFAADDSVAVFEPPQRNSGIVGGKWAERTRVVKGCGPDGVRYYDEADFTVGAIIELRGRRFLLESADDFTLDYRRLRTYGPQGQQA